MKNTKKFLSFKSFNASNPSISEMVTFSLLSTLGGVFGNVLAESKSKSDQICRQNSALFGAAKAKIAFVVREASLSSYSILS